MIVTHKFNLDLVKRELPPRIDVMQDDKYSRNLEIQLMANGKAYYPPDGCRVLIRYSKVDCTGGAYDVLPDGTEAWTIEDNVITVRLAPQVCTKNGPVKMIVTLFSGNSELNCFGLDLFVWRNPKGIYSSRRYVNVTGFIPQPASATVGQYLEVAAVDENGRITALQAVDAPEGGTAEVVLPENIVTADLTDAEGTESETIPLNADTLGGELPSYYESPKVSHITFSAVKGIKIAYHRFGNQVLVEWDGANTESFPASTWVKLLDGLLPVPSTLCKWAVYRSDMSEYFYTISVGEGHLQFNARSTSIPSGCTLRGQFIYFTDDPFEESEEVTE